MKVRFACTVCETAWPTIAEAETCAGNPHRLCPTCLRWSSLDSRYCDRDGSLLGPDPAEAELYAMQCWPVTFSDGRPGLWRSLEPPTSEDVVTLERELRVILDRSSADVSDTDH